MTKYEVKIDTDEDGFRLIIGSDIDPDRYTFPLEFPEALHEQVNLIIGGWLAEGENVRRIGAFGSGGYELSDPKHPEFHSVHADLYDNQEKV